MTAREKVIEAERQVRLIAAGELEELSCPFCGLRTDRSVGVLCCYQIAEVATAVLEHLEHLQRCESLDRMMDRFDQMCAKAGLN